MDYSHEAAVSLQNPEEECLQPQASRVEKEVKHGSRKKVSVVFVFIIVVIAIGIGITVTFFIASSYESEIDALYRLAASVGSKRPSELKLLELQNKGEICTTQTCIKAAKDFLSSINFTHDPCNDFYEFACGRRIVHEPTHHFDRLTHDTIVLVKDILKKSILESKIRPLDNLPLEQAGILYKGCADYRKLDAIGLEPLRQIVKSFGDWPILLTPSSTNKWYSANFNWIDTIAKLSRDFDISVLIGVRVGQDIKNASSQIIYIEQPAPIIPLVEDQPLILMQFKAFIKDVVEQFLNEDKHHIDKEVIEEDIHNVVEFVIELGKISSKREDGNNVERFYNRHDIKWLQETTGNITGEIENLDWLRLLNGIFRKTNITLEADEVVIITEPNYLNGLMQLLNKTPARVLSNYLNLRLIYEMGWHTTSGMMKTIVKFKSAGIPDQKILRKHTCIKYITNGKFGWPISIKYVEKHFDLESKALVSDIVENIIIAFEEILTDITNSNNGWLDLFTLQNAISKLNEMLKCIGHPDWVLNKTLVDEVFENHNQLNVSTEFEYFTNIQNLLSWNRFESLEDLHSEVLVDDDDDDDDDDEADCAMNPIVVNAFYHFLDNSITLPAASLQKPYFDKGFPLSLNYAGIGTITGHEVIHGFDNTGSQYDENGELNNWWSADSLMKYQDKIKCIEEQYNGFKPEGIQLHVNGKLTLGENIADIGALNSAYIAYQKSIKAGKSSNQLLPGIEQYNQQQLFFLGFAHIWCEGKTPDELRTQIQTDVHAPMKYRVLGPLINHPEFSKVWSCKIGSPMNPHENSNNKCDLWNP